MKRTNCVWKLEKHTYVIQVRQLLSRSSAVSITFWISIRVQLQTSYHSLVRWFWKGYLCGFLVNSHSVKDYIAIVCRVYFMQSIFTSLCWIKDPCPVHLVTVSWLAGNDGRARRMSLNYPTCDEHRLSRRARNNQSGRRSIFAAQLPGQIIIRKLDDDETYWPWRIVCHAPLAIGAHQ